MTNCPENARFAQARADRRAELQAIADQSAERAACLRLAETVADFLSRLRSSAGTLNVPERQRVVRLLVKEIFVGDDKIVIRHSIPLPANPPGGPYQGIHRGQAKTSPEVIFCVQGVITPPCGTPCFPLALSMIFSRCMTSASPTRWATFANSRSCRTLSK